MLSKLDRTKLNLNQLRRTGRIVRRQRELAMMKHPRPTNYNKSEQNRSWIR